MNDVESLRSEALRLLRSVDSLPLADAMNILRHASRLLGLAVGIDHGSLVMTEQPTFQQALTPKSRGRV